MEVVKEFPHEQELREKTARLEELNALLDVDKKEKMLLDEATDETGARAEKSRAKAVEQAVSGNRYRDTYLSKYKIRESCI